MKVLRSGNKQRLQRTIAAMLMLVSMVLYSVSPLMADVMPESSFHEWAVDTLADGEKYGVYPLDWYDNMQQPITTQQLNDFCKEIGNKLDKIEGVELKSGSAPYTYKVDSDEGAISITKGIVLEAIYKTINAYSYAVELGFTGEAISDLESIGIIKGDYTGLNLNKVCTLEEAAVFGTRIIDLLYRELDAGSKGLLWKVEKDGNTVYMLGSVHIAKYGIYPFSESILEAYKKSDVLGVEVNLYNQDGAQAFAQLATYSDGTKLSDHISAELYSKVLEAGEKLGFTQAHLDTCKPWYIANNFITMTSSQSKTQKEVELATLLGIDNYFITKALLEEKPIYEMEGYQYQGELLDGFSDELQTYYLENALLTVLNDAVGKINATTIDSWLDNWEVGEVEQFEASYNKDEVMKVSDGALEIVDKEYSDKLFTIRDQEMTSKIEKFLSEEGERTYFVVVGAAHYIGKEGVINNLKQKGYAVTQVK